MPLTGAWDDPLELARDVLEAMEEFGLSNSGWDTIKALYLLCESSEKYQGCNGYSRALSDAYDIAMCATGEECVDIEYCGGAACEYVNAEDVLESAIAFEGEHNVGNGDGFTMYLALAYADGFAAGREKDACAVHGSVAALACGAEGSMIDGGMVTAMKLYYGCADNAGAPNNSCLSAVVGAATWSLNQYVASKGDARVQRNPVTEPPKHGW